MCNISFLFIDISLCLNRSAAAGCVPDAYSEIVDKTLNKLACGDKQIRALLEELIGFTFYRRNELRKAFILVGDKSNGKSTYLYYNTKTNPALRVGDAVTNYTPYKDFGYSNGHLTFKNHFTKTQYIHISGSPLRWKLNTTQDDQVSVSFYKLVLDEEPVSAYISSVGYGTMYYGEVNLEVPAGVEAYTYVINNDGKLEVNTTYTEGNQIPAGETVVIKGSAGNYSFAVKAPTSNRDASNVLKGTDHKAMTEGGYSYYYALSLNANNDPNSVGFYWMKSNGEAFENGAHKAYLALDQTFAELAGTTVKAFVLPQEDDATGINEVLNQETQEVIYNLAGQRLQKMQKGINIVNGKKILF